MDRNRKSTSREAAGRAGEIEHIGQEWVGWRGRLVHPESPQGGGGPGFFAPTGGSEREDNSNPWQSNRLEIDDLLPPGYPASIKINPPPITTETSLGVLKQVQNDHIDVNVDGKILTDTGGGPANSAETRFAIPRASSPGYEAAKDGKITKFKGKFAWTGTITIQTHYGRGASPDVPSCYGRGTTREDVLDGNITLGFHESRHRADYVTFLRKHPLPDPPAMTIPMERADYDKDVKRFFQELEDYSKKMTADSIAQTDEVGRTKTEADAKGCYIHKVP